MQCCAIDSAARAVIGVHMVMTPTPYPHRLVAAADGTYTIAPDDKYDSDETYFRPSADVDSEEDDLQDFSIFEGMTAEQVARFGQPSSQCGPFTLSQEDYQALEARRERFADHVQEIDDDALIEDAFIVPLHTSDKMI